MNDEERAFRDALRRADTVEVPVPPLDPAEISGRGHRLRPAWRDALVAAVWVVALAGVGIAVFSSVGRGIPAVPVAPHVEATGATVEVDLFSGRENPVVEISESVTDELYALLDDKAAAAVNTDPREELLGFRGFVVTPVDDPDGRVLRILPDAVRFGPVHDYRRLDDPEQVFFRFILDSIRGSLSDDVLKAIDEVTQTPVAPDESDPPDDPPNRTGDTATWILLNPETVTPDSTDIVLGVTRLGCANGETGRVLPAVVDYGEDQIAIRVDVEAWSDQPADCQGNEEVMFSVHLDEPIGQRELVDAACLAGEAQGTSFCAGGAVRWTP